MARLNLTIPDPLYERLEKLRDRVNVSKICAAALAKELEMIEGTMDIASGATGTMQDRKVERLVERFLRQKEIKTLWYRRGRQDGETWAIERATLEELRVLGEDWDEGSISDADNLDDLDIDEDEYPTLRIPVALEKWVRADLVEAGQADSRPFREARDAADWRSYLEGWWHGVRDLWLAARTSLQ